MPGPQLHQIRSSAPIRGNEAEPPLVEVLLSTYRGARFLPEQLRSIETQSLAPRRILVRDDGSDDDTPTLLAAAAQDGRYRLLPQARLGSTKSYFELLRSTAANADYVAFADQDDVWKPGKLQRAVSTLAAVGSVDTPMLYCSRVEIVDAQLRPLGLTPHAPYHPSLANALVQNIAMGCTVVINRAARDLLVRTEPPSFSYHDWWAYLVVSSFGTVLFDPEPSLLYRQHESNAIGASANPLIRLYDRLRRQIGHRPLSLIRQASHLLEQHGAQMPAPNSSLVSTFISTHKGGMATRLRYILRTSLYRQSRIDTIVMRLLYVIRRDF